MQWQGKQRAASAIASSRSVAVVGRRRLDRRPGLMGGDVDIEAGGRDPVVGRGSPSARRPAGSDRSTPPRDGRRRPSRSANRSRPALHERRRRRLSDGWWRACPGRRRCGPRRVSRMVEREVERRTGTERQQHGVIGLRSTRRAQAGRRSRSMRERQRISTPSVVRAPRSASIAEGGRTSA